MEALTDFRTLTHTNQTIARAHYIFEIPKTLSNDASSLVL